MGWSRNGLAGDPGSNRRGRWDTKQLGRATAWNRLPNCSDYAHVPESNGLARQKGTRPGQAEPQPQRAVAPGPLSGTEGSSRTALRR
jgi:hypothetical protein